MSQPDLSAEAVNRRLAEQKQRREKTKGCLILVLSVLVVGVTVWLLVSVCGAEAEPRTWDERCLGGWDGSHRGVNDRLKAGLTSPDSFEHVETGYLRDPDTDGHYTVRVTFSAENAFGARLRGVGWGVIDPATCHVIDAWIVGSR